MDLEEPGTLQDVPVLQVTGDVDLGSADRLRLAAEDLLLRSDRRIVIDLTGVTFLDSAGLKALDGVQLRAETLGIEVALSCPQQRLVRLLQITGLDERFSIHATPESAALSGVRDA